ncbi:MAG: DinB family protein [Acidobacteria bacterium]|nr:DinB family protein [Acidobacteriota bacterium]
MSIGQSLLPEFDREMATTRRVLARVPFEKLDFKPHEKSMAMGHLANHIVTMTGWLPYTLQTESLDLAPPDGPAWEPPPLAATSEGMLAAFDDSVAASRAALAAATDEAMMQPWSLLRGGQAMFTMPRIGCVRGMILNHLVHHRGQLSVYLRMCDVPVPSIYGPSGDEQTPS